jgi:hypothetical protein
VTRLRGLADLAAAAAVTITRATGMRPDQLGALRCCDVSDGHAGLQVRTRGVTYWLPARAAGPVRAAVLDRHSAGAGDAADGCGPTPITTTCPWGSSNGSASSSTFTPPN